LVVLPAGGGECRRLLGRQPLDHFLERGTVRLGEREVEGDRGRPLFGEFQHQIAQHCARPGPLSDRRQRALIDIEHADWQLRIVLLRREALIGVERDQAQRLNRERIEITDEDRGGEHAAHKQNIEAPGAYDHRFPRPSNDGILPILSSAPNGRRRLSIMFASEAAASLPVSGEIWQVCR
jgi:hypothetical protein